MLRDAHLGTGEYDPETYWNARAAASGGDVWRAVCEYRRTPEENAVMDKVQLGVLGWLLGPVALDGARVLELGCGVGRLAPFVLGRGGRYTGLDLSREMVELARSRVPGASFEKLDGPEIPAADASFDLAFSVTVLHHNDHGTQDRLLAEMARVTRPGGHVVLLEGIAPPGGRQISFNMFPRGVDGWLRALPGGEVVRFRLVRWWLTRDLLGKVLGFSQRRKGPGLGAFERLVLRLGSAIDPYLLRWLPRRHAHGVGILFRRAEKEG